MQLGYNWLKDYIKIPFSPKELADRLTMAGLEAGVIGRFQKGLEFFKVGQIKEVSPHPNADNLSFCKVDIGTQDLCIACGASNIMPGNMVPVALPGATIPKDGKIKKTKIRGITSEGMLCSEWELNLGADRSGVMILPDDAPKGMDVAEYLNLSDTVIEVDLTPNRADCLSHLGIAREIGAMTGQIALLPEIEFPEEGEPIHNLIQIRIMDPEMCLRYVARIITGINVAVSPPWLIARLESVGIRSVNNVVDVTNFVMMETGQPLHAFDYDLIQGKKICIRTADPGEGIQTLDCVERVIDPSMLLIADAEHPLAIAGIMGGAESEVTEKTKNILIESALFNPVSIRKASCKLGLSTQASQRFEKGIDPDGVLLSANRAAQLILQIAGGKSSKGALDIYPHPVKKPPLHLRTKRVNKLLGLNLSFDKIYKMLKNLSFTPGSPPGETMEFLSPSFRQDIFEEVDIIEEIARFFGYDNIPTTIPSGKITMGSKISGNQKFEDMLKDILIGAGFNEVINYSFTKKAVFDIINFGVRVSGSGPIEIKNPLSEDQNALRPSIIPNLIQNLVFNLSRQNSDLKIFELGTCFSPSSKKGIPPEEKKKLCILMAGLRQGQHWREADKEIDFYDLKGLLEFLLDRIGIKSYVFEKATVMGLDEETSFRITYQGFQVGNLGRLSAQTEEFFDIKRSAYVAELDIDYISKISRLGHYEFRAIPKYPPVLRDLAIVVEQRIAFQQVIDLIREESGALLKDVYLFDLYIGPQIPQGKKSLALSLTYRSEEKTLTDEEVNAVHKRIIERLNSELKAELR